ncbi:MAG: hypothetical protein ACRD3D_11950 [Terriglobia bacterium]
MAQAIKVDPGLCGRCIHARVVTSDRGSVFYRCQRSDVDRDFPAYPSLPVTGCPGFDPAAARQDAPPADRNLPL